ncbi:MAG: glycosyl hydrolase [Mycobacteriales bacterium]
MSRRSEEMAPGDPRNPLVPDWPDLLDGPTRAMTRQKRSRVPLIAGISAVVVLLLVVAGLLIPKVFGGSQPVPIGPTPKLAQVPGPAVPATGAYVGAWSKPQRLTDEGRRMATSEFEAGIGRKLDIIHTYHVWDDPFPSVSDLDYIRNGYLLQLSWAGTNLADVLSGKYDAMITQRAQAVRTVGKPMFMEWRWEMDRPNLDVTGTSQQFVAAWKHIKNIFDTQGATNAAWVWCPTADGFADGRAQRYYPGDQYVDWTCVDAYPGPDWRPLKEVLAPFLAWAKHHPKPIMIGEYGVARNRTSEDRVRYLRAAEETFRGDSQIKAVSYFDSNPAGNSDRRQYLIRDDPPALREFGRMAAMPYFNPRRLPLG